MALPRQTAYTCASFVRNQRREVARIGAHDQTRRANILVLILDELVGHPYLHLERAAHAGCAILDGGSSVTMPRTACQQSHAILECGARV
jgi:hypothetical protein